MKVDIIVGGQGGDEGKGKIAQYLSLKNNYDIVLRVSVPQAGHSIIYNGEKVGLATLPCGFINENSEIFIGRGSFISVSRLEEELKKTGLKNSKRVKIDNYATIVTEEQRERERQDSNLMGKIGSVGTGTGPSRISKIKRDEIVFAKDIPALKNYLSDTVEEICEALKQGKKILLEGDHGFKLSLIHGEYPFVTSRDTTASTFLGEAGINQFEVRDVYLVLKPYVTRVAAGPLENEIVDEEKLEWFLKEGGERGSVSRRKRRIGGFEWENARRASMVNGATKLCITHMDVFKGDKNEEINFLSKIDKELCSRYPYPEVSILSYGPKINDILDFDNID